MGTKHVEMARHFGTDAGRRSGSQETLRRGAAALAVVAFLAAVGPAHAEPGLEGARQRFEQGIASAQRGDWPGALAAFTAVYRVAPDPAVLFNLAGAQFRCGKLLASNTNYRRLLAAPDDRLSRAQRQAAERQIEQIERRIPRLRLHIQGLRDDDRILLDHVRVYPDELDRDMWIDPGSHQLRIVRAHGRTETSMVALAEGEARTLALGLP